MMPSEQDDVDALSSPRGGSVLAVIPARFAASRFPGKPLHQIAGKALVHHVWDRCNEAEKIDHVIIATDDDKIAEAAAAFGAEVVMTSPDHPSGTDRVAEVARAFPDFPYILNVQGDEPLIEPELIDQLADLLRAPAAPDMVTAASPIESDEDLKNPNIVKVVLNKLGSALYFSRSTIPFLRVETNAITHLRHQGIYGYARNFLLQFVDWKASPLEEAEGLEQLRALDNGARIDVAVTDGPSAPGVDTPEQADLIATLFRERSAS